MFSVFVAGRESTGLDRGETTILEMAIFDGSDAPTLIKTV